MYVRISLRSLPCCTWARWTEARVKLTSKPMKVLIAIPACFTAVRCRLSRAFFSCRLFIGYGRGGSRVPNRIPCTSHGCRIAPSSFGLEHPRPYALCCHRLSGSPTRELAEHRQGKAPAPWLDI